MNNITEHIKSRRSVRTSDGGELAKGDIEKLASFAQTIETPYKIPVNFKFMNAENASTLLNLHSGHTFWAHILLKQDILNALNAVKNPGV